jgi:hypothetical protein
MKKFSTKLTLDPQNFRLFLLDLPNLDSNEFGLVWNSYLSGMISVPASKVNEARNALQGEWMKRNAKSKNPVRYGHGAYKHRRLVSPSKFDPRSLRTKAVSPTKKLIVGCPEGQFSPSTGRCKVGTRTQAELTLKNSLTAEERSHLLGVAIEHKNDAREHKSSIAQAFDLGIAGGLEDAAAMTPVEGKHLTANPKGIPTLWHKLARVLNIPVRGIKDVFEYPNGQGWTIIARGGEQFDVSRWEIKNPKYGGFKPNFRTRKDFVYFLENTLIPDFEESESGYAQDFDRLAGMLKGAEPVDIEFLNWIRDTLLPDTDSSGLEETAHDLREALWWLAGHKDLRGTNYQMKRKNPLWPKNSLALVIKELTAYGHGDISVEDVERNLEGVVDTKGIDWGTLLQPINAVWSTEKDNAKLQFEIGRILAKVHPILTHKNPVSGIPMKGAKLIGTDCLAMEYRDVAKARREGIQNPERPWRHDFTVKGTKIWGLPDGRVLLDGPKPLWRSQPNSVTGK